MKQYPGELYFQFLGHGEAGSDHSPASGGPQHRRRRLREIHRHEIFRVIIRKRKKPRTRPRVTAADMPLGARYLEPRPHGSPRECQIRRPQGAPDLRHRQHRVANGRFCQQLPLMTHMHQRNHDIFVKLHVQNFSDFLFRFLGLVR